MSDATRTPFQVIGGELRVDKADAAVVLDSRVGRKIVLSGLPGDTFLLLQNTRILLAGLREDALLAFALTSGLAGHFQWTPMPAWCGAVANVLTLPAATWTELTFVDADLQEVKLSVPGDAVAVVRDAVEPSGLTLARLHPHTWLPKAVNHR